MHKVFVYGTLKQGHGNHRLLEGSTLLEKEAFTPPNLTLLDLGSFPGLVGGGTTQVKGELYEVDDYTLSRLDMLEGHPTFYHRAPVNIMAVAPDGEAATYDAEAYFLPESYRERCDAIEGGVWE